MSEQGRIRYFLIVPATDVAGPQNVAAAIASEALRRGMEVEVLSLAPPSKNGAFFEGLKVRKFRFRDILTLQGVVHSHGLRPDLLNALIKFNRRRQVISLTTIHNHFFSDLGLLHSKFVVRFSFCIWRVALSKLDFRVCISEAMRSYYSKYFGGAMTLNVVMNGIVVPSYDKYQRDEDELVESWIKNQKNSGKRVLGYVGAFIDRKNIFSLINWLKDREDLALITCGHLRGLEDRCSGDSILNLGAKKNPHALLLSVDAFVLPSLAEGMPLTVLEAASLGRLTLLSDIPPHKELQEHGLGVTFDHYSFDNLCEALDQALLTNPDELVRNFEATFTSSRMFENYLKLLYLDGGGKSR